VIPRLSLDMSGVFTLALLGFFGHAILKRLSERIAGWILPEDQALSFRLAWILVRLAERLAPTSRHIWRGLTSSGGDYSVREFRWQAPEEARADLEAALREKERIVAPVRLVLPLVVSAARLRGANGWNRFRRALAVSTLVALILIVVMPLSTLFSLWNYSERLRTRLGRDESIDN
jgi:hypothetical protein